MKAYVLSVVMVWGMQGLYGPPLEETRDSSEAGPNVKVVPSALTSEQNLIQARQAREAMQPFIQKMKGEPGEPKPLSPEDIVAISKLFVQIDGILGMFLKVPEAHSGRKKVSPESPYQYARDLDTIVGEVKQLNCDGAKDVTPDKAQQILDLDPKLMSIWQKIKGRCHEALVQDAANTQMMKRECSLSSEGSEGASIEGKTSTEPCEKTEFEGWETINGTDALSQSRVDAPLTASGLPMPDGAVES